MAEKLHKVLAKGTSVQNAFENAVEQLLESGAIEGDVLPKPQKGSTKKVEGYKKEKALYSKNEDAQSYEKIFLVKAGDETLHECSTITEAKKFAQAWVVEHKKDAEIHVEYRAVEGDSVYASVAYQPETHGQWELVIVEEIADEQDEQAEETDEDADEADEDEETAEEDEQDERIAAE